MIGTEINPHVEAEPIDVQIHQALINGLSREEYDRLLEVVTRRFPEHRAEFIVSVHSGMRLTEQYSCTWGQVDLDRRTIELSKTKNSSARTVHLNSDAIAAIISLK